RVERKSIVDPVERAIVGGGQIAEAVAANRSDDGAVEVGRVDARGFVERLDDPLAHVVGVFLAQAHLFDIDAVPEALDFVPRGVVDGFVYLEATAGWGVNGRRRGNSIGTRWRYRS